MELLENIISTILQNRNQESCKFININYPVILVGGSNGKGSTVQYIANILINARYKVGVFTSPHLFHYNERISINNTQVSNEELIAALTKVMDYKFGLFQSLFLASNIIFENNKVDIAIIEVGIGGMNDITNLCDPLISAITNVSLEHCELLGKSVEEIGKNKSGIFRTNKPAFFGNPNIPSSVLEYSKEISTEIQVADTDFGCFRRNKLNWDFIGKGNRIFNLPYPSMIGDEQLYNACLAIAIVLELMKISKFTTTIKDIKHSLFFTKLVGRFEIISESPQIILDVAHNPDSVEKMYDKLLRMNYIKHTTAVFGCAKDKDWHNMLDRMMKIVNKWYLVPISNRSYNISDVYNYLVNSGHKAEITEINQISVNLFQSDERVLYFGSFLLVQEAMLYLKNNLKNKK